MLLGFVFEMDSFHTLHVVVLGMFVTVVLLILEHPGFKHSSCLLLEWFLGFLCLALTPGMQLLHAC
jgi:hypothetical protein